MLGTKLQLVLPVLEAPLRILAPTHLVGEEKEGLLAVRIPIGNLTGATARKFPVGKHMHAEECLQLRLCFETANVADSGDDASRNRHTTAHDMREDLVVHIERLKRPREILLARLFFGDQRRENRVRRLFGVEQIFDLTFRVEPVGPAEKLADELRTQALFARDTRAHSFLPSVEALDHLNESAVTRPHFIEVVPLRNVLEHPRQELGIVVLVAETPLVLQTKRWDAIDFDPELFTRARKRVGKRVARSAEHHGDPVSFEESGAYEFELVLFGFELDLLRALTEDENFGGPSFAFRCLLDPMAKPDDATNLLQRAPRPLGHLMGLGTTITSFFQTKSLTSPLG